MSELDLTWWQLQEWEVASVAHAMSKMVEPVEQLLDRFGDYLDPATAPPQLVNWLSSSIGIGLSAEAPHQQQRLLAAAPEMLLAWGTAHGIRLLVSSFLDVEYEDVYLDENGASGVSAQPGGRMPGSTPPHLHVRVRVPSDSPHDSRTLQQLLAAAVPATVPFDVQLEEQVP
ncbi:phage tail protein [Angustibacter sp. McL0619]|uniref:phage tail protein n=1 Tax=Angustibacter sp. McL0619 TaxID=3415676 RepID=UPI003CF22B37